MIDAIFCLLLVFAGFIAGRLSWWVSDPDRVVVNIEKAIAAAERDEERWVG